MYKIICPFCGAENKFPTKDAPPEDCLNNACQHYLGGLDVITIYEERDDDKKEQQLKKSEKIVGLKLIYQKTSEEIIIKTNSKIILGRKSFEKNILEQIEQISRSHCSIEFHRNKFIVSDLDSTNGTFIGLGTDRISCSTPQRLNNKDFLILGKEVFLVQFIIEDKSSKKESISTKKTAKETKTEKHKDILCSECSCVLKKLPCSCPDCGTWNE